MGPDATSRDARSPPLMAPLGRLQHAAELLFLQRTAGAERDAGERVVGHCDGQAGLVAKDFVEALQQGATAGQHNPLIANIRGELGAVFSSAIRTPSTIVPTGSESASAIWPWLIEISLGTPLTRSRPLMCTVLPIPSTGGLAMPTSFLIRSAVASPIRRLWLRRTYELMASSILSPPTRTDVV